MSITRVGSTSRNVELVNAAGAADNLPAESGWQAGDLDIIAVSWYENGAASITTPSGYTKLGADRLIGGSGPDESWASFYAKVLTAADGPSTIQFSGAVYANAVRLTLRPSSGKAFSGMPAITDGTAASATTDVVCPDVAGAAGQAQVAIAICENQHTLASAPADLDAGPAGVNTNANAVIICWRTLTGDIGAQTVVINSADGGVRGFSALVTEVSLADPVPLFRVGDTGTGSAVGGANGVGGTGAASGAGTAAASNANDTASASGTTTVTGASARTAANDTSSASGTTTVAGTLARTNAGDTASASGSVGSPITGTVAATNAGDTSSAAGTTTVTGASARTAGNDSASAAGTTTVLGTAARTNADDTGSASGSVGGAVSGTAAVTAADDTAAASGTTAVTGAVSATAGNDTATASGAAGAVSGSAAATGGDDTASAAGATAGGQQSGGWGQSSNRKPRDYTPTAEQIHAERVRLGILPAEEAPAAVAESAPVSSSAPAAAKPLAVPSLSRVEIDAAAIVAANEAIRAAIAAAQQEELSRLVWESVQQDEAAVVALIAELV